ncbi:EntF family bacteriocin induction factor [uncultured Enterococcus sp.]|nr:EntF family bacteriocin induction factor [uncultured Enterococcus sp.]
MKKLSLKWAKCPKEKLEKVVGGNKDRNGKAATSLTQCVFSFFKKCG